MNTQKDIEYILGIRKYILIATIIFLLSIMLGAIIARETSDGGDISQHVIMNIPIKERTQFERFLIIFRSNMYNCTTAVLFGIGLSIIPIYITIYNGILMGIVVNASSEVPYGIIKFIISVLPHGIIEIPIMLISMGIGLKMGYNMFSFLRALLKSGDSRLDKKIVLIKELQQGIWFYIRWVIPSLLVAAIIESYVTPSIIREVSKIII